MKLAPSQIETIELYLLSHELRDRDFYNEMLDHFIVTLENKLDQGEEFDYAFPELTHEFATFAYQATWLSQEFFGLKGMESEFINKKTKSIKNNIFGQIGKSFNKSNMILSLLILCPGLILYFFISERWSVKYVGFFNIVLFSIGLWHWFSSNFSKFILLIKTSIDLSVQERKAKQLEEFGDTYFLLFTMTMLWSFFTAIKAFFSDYVPLEAIFIPYIIIQSFLSISFFKQATKGWKLAK